MQDAVGASCKGWILVQLVQLFTNLLVISYWPTIEMIFS